MNGISVEIPRWSSAPERLLLETNEVHVWSGSLVAAPSTVERLSHTLTPDETTRADRFHFRKDRDHFIVARGILRLILSRYLEMEPGHLRFCYGAHGKPALDACPRDEMLRFNLSHSNGLAIYSITRGRDIGVDVEYMRESFPGFEIAEQFFAAREVAILRTVPADRRQEAFFLLWTVKEAYVKARGQGLGLALDQLDMSICLEGPAPSPRTNNDPPAISGWSLQPFAPTPGYIGALAVEGEVCQVKWWHWLESTAGRWSLSSNATSNRIGNTKSVAQTKR